MTKKIGYPPIVDINKSEIDAEKTKQRGRPVFIKKTLYKFRDNTGLSPWYFYWGPKNDDTTLNWMMANENYEFVTKTDKYMPDGLTPNSEGHYQYGDLVLMKCPLQEYIERRVDARAKAEAKVKSRANQFREEVLKEGGKALTDEELADILGHQD